jgi:predicted SAM-dependent methyltransferase
MKLEIGGGSIAQPGWTNLDKINGEGPWHRKAEDVPWPTGDDTVTEILASHVMEHIPAGDPRLAVMNEAHRVLAPGGVFEIRIPNFAALTWHAIADPTHVSLWIPKSFEYFDGTKAANADYGIKLWQTLELLTRGGENENEEILWRGTPR